MKINFVLTCSFLMAAALLVSCGKAGYTAPAAETAETGADVEETCDFPLWAKIEPENIYLYGVRPYGYVLYQDGKGTYFDWPGLTPRAVLPEMKYHDFDGDGEKELAVILYVASGTGWTLMDLHILEISDTGGFKPEYTDHAMLGEDARSWFAKEPVAVQSEDKKTVTVTFDDAEYIVRTDGDETESGPFAGICYGDIVCFAFDGDKIQTKIALGLSYEHWATCRFFGEVQAEVVYDGGNFVLTDYLLTLYEEE